jgi:hypothetical protein
MVLLKLKPSKVYRKYKYSLITREQKEWCYGSVLQGMYLGESLIYKGLAML